MAENSRKVTKAKTGLGKNVEKEYSGRQDGRRSFGCSEKQGGWKKGMGSEHKEERRKRVRVPAPVILQMLGCGHDGC